MEHYFNIDIARDFGVEEAILLHNFYFWISKNAANDKHLHDGLYWFYNSKKAFVELFPYMNETKIFRVIKHLEEQEIIVKGNYSKDKWDKTNWYALSLKGLEYMKENGYKMDVFSRMVQNDMFDGCKMNDGVLQNEQSILINSTNSNTNSNKEEDTNVSPKKNDYQSIVDCWNEYNGQKLGKVTKLTNKRKKSIKKQLEDNEITQEQLMALFKTLPFADSWLYNPNKQHQNWKPDFDWWMANTNGWLTKALEGKVHKENPQAFGLAINGDNAPYAPSGNFSIFWHERSNGYLYIGNYYDGMNIADGYTDDNRPDGAMLILNNARGILKWDATTKKWNKV